MVFQTQSLSFLLSWANDCFKVQVTFNNCKLLPVSEWYDNDMRLGNTSSSNSWLWHLFLTTAVTSFAPWLIHSMLFFLVLWHNDALCRSVSKHADIDLKNPFGSKKVRSVFYLLFSFWLFFFSFYCVCLCECCYLPQSLWTLIFKAGWLTEAGADWSPHAHIVRPLLPWLSPPLLDYF